MLGKTHSEANKINTSIRFKAMWDDPNSYVNSEQNRDRLSETGSRTMNIRLKENASSIYSRTKNGTIEIGGKKIFVRSSWEANIAAYLEFMKCKKEIKEWEYEPETFWFLNIKRGVRSYKPDFRITENSDAQYFLEVKGWMDPKSVTKLKRMKIYYPKVKVEVLGQDRYTTIKKMKSIIPNWGLLD
jgi:hypothetical protein